MTTDNISVVQPFFLSWNLRNIVEKPSRFISDKFTITGTQVGEFPIKAWKTYFLEVPKEGTKKDLTGRMSDVFGMGGKNTLWDFRRTADIPIYANSEKADPEILKIIIRHWDESHIPEDIPCLGLAVKCHGNYMDIREAQSISVLLIWNDGICRILTLDWFEGPEEDCITPEWYVKTTPLLNLEDAFETIKKLHKKSLWEMPIYSIFTLPTCIGYTLKGEFCEGRKQWGNEWKYSNHSELMNDLDQLFSSIQDIFSYEERS